MDNLFTSGNECIHKRRIAVMEFATCRFFSRSVLLRKENQAGPDDDGLSNSALATVPLGVHPRLAAGAHGKPSTMVPAGCVYIANYLRRAHGKPSTMVSAGICDSNIINFSKC